jgi:hypothetical protein
MKSKPALHNILKGTLHKEDKERYKQSDQEIINLIRNDKKMRIRKKPNIINLLHQQTSKMKKGEISTCLSVITLNVNSFSSPIK